MQLMIEVVKNNPTKSGKSSSIAWANDRLWCKYLLHLHKVTKSQPLPSPVLPGARHAFCYEHLPEKYNVHMVVNYEMCSYACPQCKLFNKMYSQEKQPYGHGSHRRVTHLLSTLIQTLSLIRRNHVCALLDCRTTCGNMGMWKNVLLFFSCKLKNAIWKWQAVGVYKPGGENESGPACRWKTWQITDRWMERRSARPLAS